MGEVFKIHQATKFSLQEAQQMLPIIQKITKKAVENFLVLEEKLQHHHNEPDKWKEIEKEIGGVLNTWSEKIASLGCLPKGIWLVDFDNGAGYYCWRYGDEKILYFHGYHDGFAARTAVTS
jgi:hypothetical protein